MKNFLRHYIFFFFVSISPALAIDVETLIDVTNIKAQLTTSSEVEGRAKNYQGGQYYKGVSDSEVEQAYKSDAEVHLGSTFDACQNLITITEGCYYLDLHLYWWPVTTVSVGNQMETKHFSKALYQEKRAQWGDEYSGSDDAHYSVAREEYALDSIKRAGELVFGNGVSAQKFYTNISMLPENMKYFNGGAGGLNPKDYHLTPTAAQMAWASSTGGSFDLFGDDLSQYSSEHAETYASELRNSESEKFEDLCHSYTIPAEFVSDIDDTMRPSRDISWSIDKFSSEMDKLEDNPAMCVKENMDSFLGDGTPDWLEDLVDAIGGDGGGGFANDICVSGWGRRRPVTTLYGSDKMSEPALAGLTAIKAIDTVNNFNGILGGISFDSYQFSGSDRLQWVEPQSIAHMCLPPGIDPSLLSITANKNDNPGMQTITHWKFFACCYVGT